MHGAQSEGEREGEAGEQWVLGPAYLLCTTMAALGSPVVPEV